MWRWLKLPLRAALCCRWDQSVWLRCKSHRSWGVPPFALVSCPCSLPQALLFPPHQSRYPISATRLQSLWVTAPWWDFCSVTFALHLVWGNQHFTTSLLHQGSPVCSHRCSAVGLLQPGAAMLGSCWPLPLTHVGFSQNDQYCLSLAQHWLRVVQASSRVLVWG